MRSNFPLDSILFCFLFPGESNASLGLSRNDEIYRSMQFVLFFNIFNVVVGLPFSIYSTFILEQKHGFNKQTPGFYVKDQIKKFFVSQVFTRMFNGTLSRIL